MKSSKGDIGHSSSSFFLSLFVWMTRWKAVNWLDHSKVINKIILKLNFSKSWKKIIRNKKKIKFSIKKKSVWNEWRCDFDKEKNNCSDYYEIWFRDWKCRSVENDIIYSINSSTPKNFTIHIRSDWAIIELPKCN